MKGRKVLVSEEELLETKVCKVSKKASELTREQTLRRQEQNQTHDKHKHLSSSLCRGFCTSVLFIFFYASSTKIF